MNSKHENMRYAFDFENKDGAFLLFIKTARAANDLSTSFFRKATFSDVFTNIESFFFQAY